MDHERRLRMLGRSWFTLSRLGAVVKPHFVADQPEGVGAAVVRCGVEVRREFGVVATHIGEPPYPIGGSAGAYLVIDQGCPGSIQIIDIDGEFINEQGLTGGDYSLRVAGYEVDLQPLIDKHRERYGEWLANNVLDGTFNGLRGIKSLILVGGGAVLIEDFLREWYGDKVLNRKKQAETRKIHPTEFNCIGGLRLAKMRLKDTPAH